MSDAGWFGGQQKRRPLPKVERTAAGSLVVEEWAKVVGELLAEAPEQGDWPWEDHCEGVALWLSGRIPADLLARLAIERGGLVETDKEAAMKPKYMSKHPCTGCGTGYGECAQGLVHSMMCCANCSHPTRWVDEPWTAEDLAEMKARATEAPHG